VSLVMAASLCSVVFDQRHAAARQDVDAEVAAALGLARILLRSHRQTRRRRTRLNQQATTANCG